MSQVIGWGITLLLTLFSPLNIAASSQSTTILDNIELHFSIPSQLSLESIRQSELQAHDASPLIQTSFHLGPSNGQDFPRISARITRTLPNLWRLRFPATVTPDDLEVEYKLISLQQQPGQFRHADQASTILTRLSPLSPTVIERRDNTVVIQGGLTLEFDLSTPRIAGTYLGRLTITVNQLR